MYLSADAKSVFKVNQGAFHGTWLDYFNRLVFHNFLFPATKYITTGFTSDNGSFAVITQQAFFVLDKGASRNSVKNYLLKHGFSNIRNDDYYNHEAGIILEDLHDENVFLDENNNLLFIDPVIYFETIDLGLKGDAVFRFSFA